MLKVWCLAMTQPHPRFESTAPEFSPSGLDPGCGFASFQALSGVFMPLLLQYGSSRILDLSPLRCCVPGDRLPGSCLFCFSYWIGSTEARWGSRQVFHLSCRALGHGDQVRAAARSPGCPPPRARGELHCDSFLRRLCQRGVDERGGARG